LRDFPQGSIIYATLTRFLSEGKRKIYVRRKRKLPSLNLSRSEETEQNGLKRIYSERGEKSRDILEGISKCGI